MSALNALLWFGSGLSLLLSFVPIVRTVRDRRPGGHPALWGLYAVNAMVWASYAAHFGNWLSFLPSSISAPAYAAFAVWEARLLMDPGFGEELVVTDEPSLVLLGQRPSGQPMPNLDQAHRFAGQLNDGGAAAAPQSAADGGQDWRNDTPGTWRDGLDDTRPLPVIAY